MANFLKGLQVIFGENKTLHICIIINNEKHALKDSICTKVNEHCVKSVQIRSYFWSVFPCIQCLNTGKYGPEISPYLDIFHGV